MMDGCYYNGVLGLQQDQSRVLDLWIRAAALGFTKSHYNLGMFYYYDNKEAVENWLMTGECQEDMMESFYRSNQHNWEEPDLSSKQESTLRKKSRFSRMNQRLTMKRNCEAICLSTLMNIEHTCAQGRVCIGLNMKVRLFLHGSYPIIIIQSFLTIFQSCHSITLGQGTPCPRLS
jgi:hypothetical protein